MFRSLSVFLAVLLLAATAPSQNAQKKSALDKATLEAYVRHLFALDSTRVALQVGEPKASTELPGFMDVNVRASMGGQSQDFKFLVSKDGQKILQANVYDVNYNPFKPDLDKLKTELEPSFGTPGAPV